MKNIKLGDAQNLVKAFLFSTLCFLVTFSFFTPVYLTNDDSGYALMLSGKLLFNQPTSYILFEHIFYTSFIRYLYAVNAAIPWYPIVQLFLLWCCLIIHNYYIFQKNKNVTGWLLAILLYCCFYISLVLKIHFSITSFVLGITSFTLLIKSRDLSTNRLRILLIIIFLLLTSIIRWEVWQFVMFWIICFMVISFLFEYRRKVYTIDYRRSFIIIAASIFLCLSFHQIDIYFYSKSGNESYREYNYYRSHLNDYSDVNFFRGDERYKILSMGGWYENDYVMMQHWIFMDKEVYSKKNMKAIVDEIPKQRLFKKRILDNFKNLPNYIQSNASLRIMFLVSLLVLLLFGASRRTWLIFILCQILFLVTMITRKYPPESFYSASYLMLAYFLIDSFSKKRSKSFALVLMTLFATYQLYNIQVNNIMTKDRQHMFYKQLKMIQDDSAHIYFNWDGLDLSLIKPLDDTGLNVKNIISPGVFAVHPLNLTKIKDLGIQDFMLELSTNDRIYVVFRPYCQSNRAQIDYNRNDYAAYMLQHYGLAIQSSLVLNHSEISVWDFSLQKTKKE